MFIAKLFVSGVVFTGIVFALPLADIVAKERFGEIAPAQTPIISQPSSKTAVRIAQSGVKKHKRAPVDPDDEGLIQSDTVDTVILPPASEDASKESPSPPENQAAEAVRLLKASFASAIPPTVTKDPSVTGRELTTLTFFGTSQKLAIRRTDNSRVHWHATNVVTSSQTESSFEADFSQLEKVKAEGSVLEVFCAKLLGCLSRKSATCFGSPKVCSALSVSLDSTYNVAVADADTAENVRFAIDFLIKANSLKPRGAGR